MNKWLTGALMLSAAAIAMLIVHPPSTEIAFHIGKPYEAVVQDSTFPVKTNTAFSDDIPPDPDSTWIDDGRVVFRFDDLQHGFTLPPTRFGAVMYRHGQVSSMGTSPMMEALPFDEAATLLEQLQTTFRNAGWRPAEWEENDWLDTSPGNRAKLQAGLFAHAESVELVVPGKYGMFLHLKCYGRCNERNTDTAKYLIDIGIGDDFSG
jgi:hypothetical protein